MQGVFWLKDRNKLGECWYFLNWPFCSCLTLKSCGNLGRYVIFDIICLYTDRDWEQHGFDLVWESLVLRPTLLEEAADAAITCLFLLFPASSVIALPQVLHIKHGFGVPEDGDPEEAAAATVRERRQRKSFLRELEAMIRLRSPHIVHVYGKVTSRKDRFVLVMELLVGGDLRTLLTSSDRPLPEEQSQCIIGDICAGMAFLHSKETVHGDLKSANVLLDAAGRAKVMYIPQSPCRCT